jgi:hypothetical protein
LSRAQFWVGRNCRVPAAKTAGKIAGWTHWRQYGVIGTKTAFVRR